MTEATRLSTKSGGIERLIRKGLVAMLLVVITCAFDSEVRAGQLDLAGAINIAGRQRMLTQRIVFTYCQVGQGVMVEESRRRLAESLTLFDDQLAALKKSIGDPWVQEAIAQTEALWKPFKALAQQEPTREGAERLLFWNDDLLHASHKIVLLLQDQLGTPVANLVNLSGRQRMLSQRLAKFYMLREWGFDTLTIREEMAAARNGFESALILLSAASQNTEEIKRELDRVALQWSWFDLALTLQNEDVYRLVVADSGETILQGMDRVTALYEKLSGF